MEKTALILEGGGMRGVYTAGVLDGLMEEGIFPPTVYGVSAGACNAMSYLSREKGRYARVSIGHCDDPRYMGKKALFTTGSMFCWDFMFYGILEEEPFDYDGFYGARERLVIVTTDADTGEAVYFDNRGPKEDIVPAIIASSSLPILSPPVKLAGRELVDGGVAESIPIEKSIRDGNEKHLVILTRNKGYRKKRSKTSWLYKLYFRKRPKLAQTLATRYLRYNAELDRCEELERQGKALVIRPSQSIHISRTETDKDKLWAVYRNGCEDVKRMMPEIRAFLQLPVKAEQEGE